MRLFLFLFMCLSVAWAANPTYNILVDASGNIHKFSQGPLPANFGLTAVPNASLAVNQQIGPLLDPLGHRLWYWDGALIQRAFPYQAVVDKSGLFVGLYSASTPLTTGTTLVSIPFQAPLTNPALWSDDLGRLNFALQGRLVVPSSPGFSTAPAFKALAIKKAITAVDQLEQQAVAVERWQASFSSVRDRSAELNALNSKIQSWVSVISSAQTTPTSGQ